MSRRFALGVVLGAVLSLGSGCSLSRIAADTVGELLFVGDGVFATEDDIELIGGALPFSLKLAESLLSLSPENRGLLLTASRGYVLYSYAFVQFPAEQAAFEDVREARRLRARARKFYMRAFDYAVRGLALERPGLGPDLARAPTRVLAGVGADPRATVPFLYWGASALGLAISVSKDDPAMLARLPEVDAMLQRALALDEDYDDGALHEFAVIWGGASPLPAGPAVLDRHYARAHELSGGRRASLYVAYALARAVPRQDRAQFEKLMKAALRVDPDAVPRERLANTIAQRRARWLMGRAGELFLE